MSSLALTESAVRRALGTMAPDLDGDDLLAAYARSVWSVLVEPGDRVAGALVDAFGAVRALELGLGASSVAAAAEPAGLSPAEVAQGRKRWGPRVGDVERALDLSRRSGVRLITPDDEQWPTRAADLGPFAPICLWARGDPRRVRPPRQAVAIVGARAASSYGEHVAAELAAEAAAVGVSVFSGAAYGIDAAAHAAALSAGGHTVAVMAGGLDRAYPVGNSSLIDRIASSGAVISEVPCGTTPTKHRFLSRNRLIAAFTDATIVVEAGWRSGSINTAHHAQAIGRPVGAVPGPITSASSMGCHRLLREGDAVCITGIRDVCELIGAETFGPASLPADYTDDRVRVLDAMSARSPRSTDDIARRAGFAGDEVAALLGFLELDGVVARRGDGWVQLTGTKAATLW